MIKTIELTPEQDNAANPTENVWIQANAGTGKTGVLTQRLLRILFRTKNPTKSGILCLTYTNAGAGEMRCRILKNLRDWARASDAELAEVLTGITENKTATKDDIAHARQIFFTFIDNQDMLKVKTIHSFCEEILRRFPLEAGISPSWSLLSQENQNVLLQDAFNRLMDCDNPDVISAFEHIVSCVSEYRMSDLLGILISKYKDFFDIENFDKYRKQFIETTTNFLRIKSQPKYNFDKKHLENIVSECQSVKNPPKYIQEILTTTQQFIDKTIDFEKYSSVWLKNAKNAKNKPFLADEVYVLSELDAYQTNKSIFEDTIAVFDLSAAFAHEYFKIKQERNLLDFEDLILFTRKLFSNPETMGWVLSQLDISLSHILLDEAQDTTPLQWDILNMLSGDFFTDGNTGDLPHSLFIVGDTKQSIYGFMDVSPERFASSRKAITQQIKNNFRTIREIPLTQNFRSLYSILYTVDKFFESQSVKEISGFANNAHVCHRKETPGLVEMHGLIAKGIDNTTSLQYVKQIADKIKSMIDTGEYLPSDFLVLVQSRHPFAAPLIKELKLRNISVAGSDKIILPQFPAIADLLNLIRFCIDVSDDYRLCCVLKSPLYRFSESEIYALCKLRNDENIARRASDPDATKMTVFDALKQTHSDVYQDLLAIIEKAQAFGPYSFFTYVLQHNNTRKKMIAALGEQIIDPLEEFMTICLAYERTQPGTMCHFIKWFITTGAEVKRDMNASSGVRIMTVHGSKGLQSRVVFLIDTVRLPQGNDIIPIPNSNSWLWTKSSGVTSDELDVARGVLNNSAMAEYYRLLYVAMTRACDELYIYGYTANKNPKRYSWHDTLWNVLPTIPDAETTDKEIRIIHAYNDK